MQVAFGRGAVAVAHHPLNLVDLEHADRLGAEGVAQLVQANPRKPGTLAGAAKAPIQARAADRLPRLGVVLEDERAAWLAQAERPEDPPHVRAHWHRAGSTTLVASEPAGGRIAVLQAHQAHREVDVFGFQGAEFAQSRTGLGRERVDRGVLLRVRLDDQPVDLLGGIEAQRMQGWPAKRWRTKRLGLIAGYAAPYEPPRDPGPEQHIEVSQPGELVGIDCFYVGRLKGTEGAIWQLTAIDIASSYAWAELVICKQGNPTARQTSKLAERVARDLKAAGWKLQRMLSDNGNEFRGSDFTSTLQKLYAAHSRIHAGRPQTNGNVEALHKTILDECWRPAFARYIYPRYSGLKRELATYLRFYNADRVHHGRLTRGRIPAEIVYGARKMEAR
jgi:transposase InsO family protein